MTRRAKESPGSRTRSPVIYGYVRVSSDRQVESGLSLSGQRSRIAAYARAAIGRGTPHVYSDGGVSGRTPFARRPQGKALDAVLQRGDHVVICKLDRGFRSVRDCATQLERWDRRGITVHLLDVGAATNTPAGRLIIGIMAVIAEWESRRIGERIREAQAVMRARGLATNPQAPLGYRIRNRRLVPDPRTRRVIGLIWRLRHSRRRPPVTYQGIANWLTSQRIRPYPWSYQRVIRALCAPEAAQWARAVLVPAHWHPPVGYRHAGGERKRRARMKVAPALRRYIATLAAAAAAARRR